MSRKLPSWQRPPLPELRRNQMHGRLLPMAEQGVSRRLGPLQIALLAFLAGYCALGLF